MRPALGPLFVDTPLRVKRTARHPGATRVMTAVSLSLLSRSLEGVNYTITFQIKFQTILNVNVVSHMHEITTQGEETYQGSDSPIKVPVVTENQPKDSERREPRRRRGSKRFVKAWRLSLSVIVPRT